MGFLRKNVFWCQKTAFNAKELKKILQNDKV